MQPMSTAVLERYVLAKPYFDRPVCVATVDGTTIGFAHAGFGPNADESELSKERGVICPVELGAAENAAEIAGELLAVRGLFPRPRVKGALWRRPPLAESVLPWALWRQ